MSNKTSDKNVAIIENDVNELKSIMNLRTESGFAYSQKNTLSLQKAIKNVLADYTRQKEMNEEHQKINGELRQAINTVEKEKADWIKAYQEEKDSQFELLKRIKELEEERNHWHGCFIVAMENGIAKEKVKNVLKNNRNEIFSATYLSREQFRPYEMQIERINKIEQELIGEDK